LETWDYRWPRRRKLATPIAPGETIEVTLSNSEYESIQAALDMLDFPANISAARLAVRSIRFIDGTVWAAGTFLKRDPKKTDSLIPEKN
jgi:hypothetical protein